MTVKQLRKLLRRYDKGDEVVINNNNIKILGVLWTGETFEEHINSAGGLWEGGCGISPGGRFCGECATFNCDECGWEKREQI